MKSVAFALLTLFAVSASAGEYTHYGRILFQSASTFVPANKTCLNGSSIRYSGKMQICDESGDNQTNCRLVAVSLKQPVESTRVRCKTAVENDQDCEKITVPFIQGPTVKYAVYRDFKDYEDDRSPVSSGRYTIRGCQ